MLFLGVAAHAASGVNQTLSFEGRLLSSNGSVVPDGYYNIQFKIYENGDGQEANDTGGTLDWTETYINNGGTAGVKVTNGFFSVNLGSQTPFGGSVNWNNDTLWLSMNVAGSASTCTTFNSGTCVADGEMTPMNRITSAPYAMNSGELGGLGASNFLQLAQGVQTDASSNASLAINKTGSGNFIDLQNTGTDVFNVDNSGNINLGGDSNKTISVSTAADSTNGSSLTVSGGTAGGGSGGNGGNLVLQGGDATGTGSTTTAITFEGSSNGSQAANVVTFTAPSGIAVNDLLIAFVRNDTTAAAAAPLGWTKDQTINNGSYTETRYHKYATSSDVAGTTYAFTGPGSYTWGEMAQLRPAVTPTNPAADPFAVVEANTGSTSASVSLSSTSQPGILLAWGAEIGTDTGFSFLTSPTTSFTKVGDTNGSALGWASAATSTAYTVNVTVPDNTAALMSGIVTDASVSGIPANPNGGNVIIKSGSGSGTGTSGNITLQGGTNSQVVIDNSGVTIGHTSGGTTTTLNLDSGSSAPTGDVLGSMYYDTTLGEVQCYEASGWGDCSNSPNQFISLSPTYANAVVHPTGTGTLTTDMCSDALNINDGTSGQPTVCGTNETYNYYDWTSTQTSSQTRSLFVTYQLPSNFKGFANGSTSLKARTDSTDATVSYKVYRNDSSGLTECGSAVSASSGSQTSWQTGTASGTTDPANCSFAAGDSIVFEIDLTADNSANAYISNLNFTLK